MKEIDYSLEGREYFDKEGRHFYRLDGEWVEMHNLTPAVIGTIVVIFVAVALFA